MTRQQFSDLVNLERYPVDDGCFRKKCKNTLERDGAVVLANFLNTTAIESIQNEGNQNRSLAYYTAGSHNIYLKENDFTN